MTFVERFAEADGFRIRYLQAGTGQPLIHVPGAGGPQLTRAHELLSERYRVIVLEPPESASTLNRALAALGIERCALWGTLAGASTALNLALENPAAIDALVLESPAIQPADQARLSEIQPLTLVLLGTDDASGLTGSTYKENIQRCFLVLVYGAGPAIASDRPQAVADMVDDFLQRQERFIVSATPSVVEP